MAKLKLTDEQLETMSYGDVAAYVLEQKGKKQKIQDLFKEVISLMNLPESDFENHIADFFQLLSTDEEEIETEETEEEIIDDEDAEINYDDDNLDDDPEEDDFKDLVIIDDSDENGSNQEI